MKTSKPTHSTGEPSLLLQLGERVRALRANCELTRRELAMRSGLSERFLARIESGQGNLSLKRFCDLARALGIAPSDLLREANRPRGPFVALIGLRGAGKSTIGKALAMKLDVPFVELDTLIEEDAGIPLSQVFEMHGERYYRQRERQVLEQFVERTPAAVIATGGGIIGDRDSFELLRRCCTTVWLHARAEDHWNRVIEQGDRRPMAGNPNAMKELRDLLAERAPLYAAADLSVDTSALGVTASVERILAALTPEPRARTVSRD